MWQQGNKIMRHVGNTSMWQVAVNEEKDSEFAKQINLMIEGIT